jgi:hypothetical protein
VRVQLLSAMFVLVAQVMEVIIKPMAARRTFGLAFILPIVRRSAHPIPETSSRRNRFGFEGKNRNSHAPSIVADA